MREMNCDKSVMMSSFCWSYYFRPACKSETIFKNDFREILNEKTEAYPTDRLGYAP